MHKPFEKTGLSILFCAIEIELYGKRHLQIDQDPMKLYWRLALAWGMSGYILFEPLLFFGIFFKSEKNLL